VVNELISFPAGNEFYWVDARSLAGSTFSDAIVQLKEKCDALPIAIGRAGGAPLTNPPGNHVLESTDRLLVIAPEVPQLP
jgi:hypothetical protein